MTSVAVAGPSFRHGVHPDENKEGSEHLPIQRMPFVSRYIIPLSQQLGAPAKAIVEEGQRVERGEIIAEPGTFVSIPHHSPVTGWVRAVAPRRHANGQLMPAIEIEADPYATQRFEPRPPIDWRSLSNKEFVAEVQKAGLVGMGGAAFPSHVKYAGLEEGSVKALVVNGSECEPYLTCDHRLMVERPEAILRGTAVVREKIGAEKAVIGIEMNKPDAVETLEKHLEPDSLTEIVAVKVKYPQGAEKMLINAIFKVEVPAGKLPIDIGMVVNNVGTMAALADYLDTGMPLIERVLTVSGPGIENPANLIVPIGTPVRDVLEFCGGVSEDTREIILGGPMMGQPTSSLDVPVMKGNSGILAFTETETSRPEEWACVRCGRCAEACPYFLNPSLLGRLSRARRYDDAEQIFVLDCMECGSCTFACPSSIPLVQLIRVAKSEIRNKKARAG
jgi:electron transport complex protein RnfC